jgi:hypothetical protein
LSQKTGDQLILGKNKNYAIEKFNKCLYALMKQNISEAHVLKKTKELFQ